MASSSRIDTDGSGKAQTEANVASKKFLEVVLHQEKPQSSAPTSVLKRYNTNHDAGTRRHADGHSTSASTVQRRVPMNTVSSGGTTSILQISLGPSKLRAMWSQWGHRFKKLEYKTTPVHEDLMALVANYGEAYLKERDDVFKAVLDVDRDLVDLDSSEGYVTTEVDGSEGSAEYGTNPEDNGTDSPTPLTSLPVVANRDKMPPSRSEARVNNPVTWNEAATPRRRGHYHAVTPRHRNHDHAAKPSPSGRIIDTPRPKGVSGTEHQELRVNNPLAKYSSGKRPANGMENEGQDGAQRSKLRRT